MNHDAVGLTLGSEDKAGMKTSDYSTGIAKVNVLTKE